MKYFLGIDGGGTKTAYLLIDKTGNEVFTLETRGCSYKEYGMETVIRELREGMLHCLSQIKETPEALIGVAAGLPCYGESPKNDEKLKQLLTKELEPVPVYLTNDVEVGWAGSLGLEPGINVVAGTGSIAYGKNSRNVSARAGGWSTFFGDEGSCYWLGRRTMELFSKEADKREEEGPLYEIIMKEFQLSDPMNFIDLMEQEYVPYRSKVASLQKLLLKAANAGDLCARELYRQAAAELGKMINAVALQIAGEEEEIKISYSGGLFHAKEYIIPALEPWIKKNRGCLVSPRFMPVQGAVLLAVSSFKKENLDVVLAAMQDKRKM